MLFDVAVLFSPEVWEKYRHYRHKRPYPLVFEYVASILDASLYRHCTVTSVISLIQAAVIRRHPRQTIQRSHLDIRERKIQHPGKFPAC